MDIIKVLSITYRFSGYLITVPLKGRNTKQLVAAIEDNNLILKLMPPLIIRSNSENW